MYNLLFYIYYTSQIQYVNLWAPRLAKSLHFFDTSRKSIDVRTEGCSAFARFEAHFSEGDIRDMLAVRGGKRTPVAHGKIVPRYLDFLEGLK